MFPFLFHWSTKFTEIRRRHTIFDPLNLILLRTFIWFYVKRKCETNTREEKKNNKEFENLTKIASFKHISKRVSALNFHIDGRSLKMSSKEMKNTTALQSTRNSDLPFDDAQNENRHKHTRRHRHTAVRSCSCFMGYFSGNGRCSVLVCRSEFDARKREPGFKWTRKLQFWHLIAQRKSPCRFASYLSIFSDSIDVYSVETCSLLSATHSHHMNT